MDKDKELPVSSPNMARLIFRGMRRELTPVQLTVLCFIYERTYLYGKEWDDISASQFLEGVGKDGEMITPGLGIKRSALYGALSVLQQKGMLQRRDNGSKTPSYSIDYMWGNGKYFYFPEDACPPRWTHLSTQMDTTIENNTIHVARSRAQGMENQMPNPMDKVAAAISAASTKSKDARDRRKKQLNATALYKIWEDAWREHIPDERMFAWRSYEVPAFKKALNRGVPDYEAEAFIVFCVEHYANVITSKFSWAKGVSKLPNPTFVLKNVDRFYEAFREFKDPNSAIRKRIENRGPVQAPVDDTEKEELKAKLEKLERQNKELRAVRAKPTTRRTAKRYLKRGKKTDTQENSGNTPFRKWD